jgi:hypothetical protein
LLELAVNLGWAGQVVYTAARGLDHASNTWTGLLPKVIWALVGLLPSLVVLTDSPARREGFLATRPLPRRDLFVAKLLFVLALVVAPWVIEEMVHLAGRGMPAWVVWRGTLEQLMFALPVAVAAGAYAALWPGPARWARALAVTVVLGYLGLVTGALTSVYIFHADISSLSPNTAQELAGLYALMLALMALAVWHSRAHRGVLPRWTGVLLALMCYGVIAWFWPWNFFALRPENQPSANSVMETAGFKITPRALRLQKVEDPDEAGQPHFNISMTPRTGPMPTNCLVEWSDVEAKLTRASGGEIHGGGGRRHHEPFSGHFWNYYFSPSDFAAWSAAFPPDVLFRQNNYFGPNQSGFLDFSGFELPASHEELNEQVTLRAGFEARIFQWQKIADLPLTPGATATDEFGSWKYIATQKNAIPDATISQQFYVQRSQIELSTAADSRCSSAESGPLSRMAFMIYDPLRHVASVEDQSSFNNVTRSMGTALAQYFIEFYFNGRKPFTPEEVARCRLVVFEKSWVGSVPEAWQSPAFTIDEKLPSGGSRIAGNQDPMQRAEFNRRVAALKAPPPDASRRDVSQYVLDFLRLVDARRVPLDPDDPHTRQLAAFVPMHLDLLLDGLPVMDYASKETVLNAIQAGATDAQKPAIIAALQREPELAGVLLARGWVDDARPEILQLAQSQRDLPLDALRAIAWFREPQTYPRLLEEFEAGPNVEADDALRTLPGVGPNLDAIVSRVWRRESLVDRYGANQMFGQPFQLAMRHGERSALQRIYLFLDDPEAESMNVGWTLANSFGGTIQMPDVKPEERDNPQAVAAWLRKHRPEDFVFNAELRQFVPRPGASAAQTASTGHP